MRLGLRRKTEHIGGGHGSMGFFLRDEIRGGREIVRDEIRVKDEVRTHKRRPWVEESS